MVGNPDHPYSAGELCPKVNRYLKRVYHQDRILTPLRRTGPKGSGEFEPITWDEATTLVADRLREVISRYGGEAIARWSDAGTQGLLNMTSLDRRFFARIGASQMHGSLCGATAGAGLAAAYGDGRGADPMEVVHAKLVILWANNTRLTNRHLWPFVQRARDNGARIIVIDPLRTVTAESADWFIQPLPGTDVALMLAMMHVIIRDGLCDESYIADHSVGYQQLADEVSQWPPERAAGECGIDAADIEQLATEYATTQPAMIRTLIGAEHHPQGAMFFRTLGCLPVLTGAWRHRGGGVARSVGIWSGVNVDDAVFDVDTDTRSLNMNELGADLCDSAVGIHAVFIWNGNPVISTPDATKLRRGLSRDDLFCVVSEQFMTDTAAYADVVFPATTQVEQLDVVPSWGSLYMGWNEPAIEPLGEAVPNVELWRRLARAMGLDDPEFALSDEELLRSALTGVDVDELRARGWLRVSVPEPLMPYAEGGFATASGRAELWSEIPPAPGQPLGPTYRRSWTEHGEFALLSPKWHTRFLNTTYSDHHGPMETGPHLYLSAGDAQRLGIADETLVEISNHRGALCFPAAISERLRPGVVAVPWGWWGTENGINALTSDHPTDWGGGVSYSSTRVDLRIA